MIRRSGGEAGHGQTWREHVFAEAGGWVFRIEGIYQKGIVGLERNWLGYFWKRGWRSHLGGPPAALQNLKKRCVWRNHWHSLAGLSPKVKDKNGINNVSGPAVIMGYIAAVRAFTVAAMISQPNDRESTFPPN